MKKILLLLVIVILGLGAGGAAGLFLRPAPEAESTHADSASDSAEVHAGTDQRSFEGGAVGGHAEPLGDPVEQAGETDYVSLDKQFIVPVVEGETVRSLIVVSLAVEVDEGQSDLVFEHEPRLRDAFLRALFLHARSGGFMGGFSEPETMDDLKAALLGSAREILGTMAREVLVTNIIRQDT